MFVYFLSPLQAKRVGAVGFWQPKFANSSCQTKVAVVGRIKLVKAPVKRYDYTLPLFLYTIFFVNSSLYLFHILKQVLSQPSSVIRFQFQFLNLSGHTNTRFTLPLNQMKAISIRFKLKDKLISKFQQNKQCYVFTIFFL